MHRRTLLAVCAGVAIGVGLVLALAAIDNGKPRHAALASRSGQRHRPPVVGAVAIATAYLGVERAQIRSALRSGRTLGEIASAVPGHSAAGLIARIVSAQEAAIAKRVRAGTLAPALARRRLTHLRERVAASVLRRRRAPPSAPARRG
jgi:hypothetical protein